MIVAGMLRRNRKMTSTTSATASDQFELHVVDRGADRGGAVRQHGDIDAGGQRGLQLGQQSLDAVDHVDDVCARLALHVDDQRRGRCSSSRRAWCSRRPATRVATSCSRTGAPLR